MDLNPDTHPSTSSYHDLHYPSEIPDQFRSVFALYKSFNTVQSQVFDHVFLSNESLVVAAPTGSGKTVIFEMAIVKLLVDIMKIGEEKCFKMVYIAPVKALCKERYNDWNPRFAALGISCVEVTGDSDDYFALQPHQLIITTPEKFDSLTRKWRDNASLVQMVKLFMIDEVHLLNESKRGPVLEAIVCRMKTVAAALKSQVRYVAVSATVFNVEDLAEWLGSSTAPAHCHKFGNEVRPVKLTRLVKGYSSPPGQSPFLFDLQLSFKMKQLILDHAKGRPTLVFCSTRKGVVQTCKTLSEQLSFHFSEKQLMRLKESAQDVLDNKLREMMLQGVGYHHAGMTVGDRHLVQTVFLRGWLPVLVATTTLAMGVNLPAHLVIIKGTQQYMAGKMEEYSESTMLQMIGRAGRPQFDTTATAIIMTRDCIVAKYERMLDSKEVVESSLHAHLPEHLNSEVVLYTITDIAVAMDWIRHTFLYVRAMKNPKHYGLDAPPNHLRIEKLLEAICLKEINALMKAGLIDMKDNGMDISPTPNGRLMSHFYLSFDTFKIFLELEPNRTVGDLLAALSEAQEFFEVQLRVNERKTLNELNRSKGRECVRFPLSGKIKTRAMKVNCLIQACLGCLHVQDPGLQQESHRVVSVAERLTKCLLQVLSKRQCYQSLLNATLLAKCLHARMWENLPYVCRQLDRIGPTLGAVLAACGKTTFESIENSNPRDLEQILNRAPPFGNHLQDAVKHFPKYELQAVPVKRDSTYYEIRVTLFIRNLEQMQERSTAGLRHGVVLLIGDANNTLLLNKNILDQTLMEKPFETKVLSIFPNRINVDVVSEQFIGLDVSTQVVLMDCSPEPSLADQTKPGPAKKKKKTKDPQPRDDVSQYWGSGPIKKVLRDFKLFLDYDKPNPATEHATESYTTPVVKRRKTDNAQTSFVSCFDIGVELVGQDTGVLGHSQEIGSTTELSRYNLYNNKVISEVQIQGQGYVHEEADIQGHGYVHEEADIQGHGYVHEEVDIQGHGYVHEEADIQGHGYVHEEADIQGHGYVHEEADIQGHGYVHEEADIQGHGYVHEEADIQGHEDTEELQTELGNQSYNLMELGNNLVIDKAVVLPHSVLHYPGTFQEPLQVKHDELESEDFEFEYQGGLGQAPEEAVHEQTNHLKDFGTSLETDEWTRYNNETEQNKFNYTQTVCKPTHKPTRFNVEPNQNKFNHPELESSLFYEEWTRHNEESVGNNCLQLECESSLPTEEWTRHDEEPVEHMFNYSQPQLESNLPTEEWTRHNEEPIEHMFNYSQPELPTEEWTRYNNEPDQNNYLQPELESVSPTDEWLNYNNSLSSFATEKCIPNYDDPVQNKCKIMPRKSSAADLGVLVSAPCTPTVLSWDQIHDMLDKAKTRNLSQVFGAKQQVRE